MRVLESNCRETRRRALGVTQVTWQSRKTLQVIAGLGDPQLGDTGVMLKADSLTFSEPEDGQDMVAD